MIEQIHKHLLSEIDRSARSDTVFVLSGVAFNLMVLFINWIQASSLTNERSPADAETMVIFVLFLIGTIVASYSCTRTLTNSRNICVGCHEALSRIYEDSGVLEYMPEKFSHLGYKRYFLSMVVVGSTGLLAVLVPITVLVLS